MSLDNQFRDAAPRSSPNYADGSTRRPSRSQWWPGCAGDVRSHHEGEGTTGIFALTAALLFGVSALYHRGHWSQRGRTVLRRLDHASIFLIIAGTYTPFTILLLDGQDARILLTLVWAGALLGVAFRVLWVGAPRWLYLPVYVALGWAAVFWLPTLAARGGAAVFVLIVSGGLLYSAGAVVYGLKRPDPSPRWFGFHEIFHACTLAGFAAHHVGVWLAAFGIGAAVAT